jgi:ATP-grasp ribosomal peptide maturase
MPATGTVLVITEPDDPTADDVIRELNARAVPVARFNPADIGSALTVTAEFGGNRALSGWLRTPSRRVNLADVRSVYWRRPTWPQFEHLDSADAEFAAAQVRSGLRGILLAMPGARWVNDPEANRRADYKPLQLAAAVQAGFTVPATLVTSDADAARDFIKRHGSVICKALRWTPYRGSDGVGMTTWTEPVSAEEIDDSLGAAPHLFQARVDKVADLRVVVVGDRVFAVRIDSGLLDWRRDYSALKYSVITPPKGLGPALVAFLHRLGLVSGSFDLCIDQAGDLHWLEVNPNGQWGWLAEATDLPIAAAFADLLEQGA